MAFPPVFDRAWDETFPPDTQPANLLGQDIRNFKTDIRERIASLSGVIANRPNPDAIYGGIGFGTIYLSTDTQQTFQWNGAAWIDISNVITPNLLNAQGPKAAIVGNGADQTIFTYNLAANVMKAGAGIRIKASWLRNVGNNNTTYKFMIGASVVETLVYAPQSNIGFDIFQWDIINNPGVQNAQYLLRESSQNFFGFGLNTPAANVGILPVPFDSSVLNAVTLTFAVVASDQLTPLFWLIENIHA